ncbi:Pentatricopeptide repeat-containing protein, partial [Mucuna pruriens]
MLVEECLPNSITFNVLIDVLHKEDKVQDAMWLVEDMANCDVKPTLHTYTILVEENVTLTELMRLSTKCSPGYQPIVVAYTTFIKAYCSHGRLEEVEETMVKIKNEDMLLDSFIYNLLINAYGCMRLLDNAFGVLKHMFDIEYKKEGNNLVGLNLCLTYILVDNVNIWNIIDFEITTGLFDKMVEYGCLPSVNTYNKLIKGLCRVGRLDVVQMGSLKFCKGLVHVIMIKSPSILLQHVCNAMERISNLRHTKKTYERQPIKDYSGHQRLVR